MALTFVKVNDWARNACRGVNLATDQLAIALSNTAPASESSNPASDGNGVLANVTQISYTNMSSRNVTTTSWTQTGGVASLVLVDLTLTMTGGASPTFRYIYLYDDTVASPVIDPLIGYWDRGSGLSIPDGSSYTLDFAATTWTLTVS